MKKEINIASDKKYHFPKDVRIVYYKDKILVISVNTGCWIVLDNEQQLSFFQLLQTFRLDDALGQFDGDYSNAQWVVTQLEARKFESQDIIKSNEHTFMIYLTNECNLRCPHCYMAAGEASHHELSTEEICNLLKSYHNYGGDCVTLSGGEVTKRSDLYDIVHYGYSLGISVHLLTNGTLWTNELIDKISPLVSRIQISIDGFSEEENARVRGKGNFNKALATLDRFLKNGVTTDVAITPYFDNTLAQKIRSYADFGRKLHELYKNYKIKIMFTSGLMDGRELHTSLEEKEYYKRIMTDITTLYFGEEMSDYTFVISNKERRIMDNCAYGCLYISANGEIYGCSIISQLKPFANVRTHTFDQIMELSRKAQALSNVNNLIPCKDCELKYICGGGCRVKEFADMRLAPIELPSKPIRPCDMSIKKEFYDLMIRTNILIFQ